MRRLARLAAATVAAALSKRRPLYCLWEITHRCNARCAMCALWRQPTRAADELALDSIKLILDKLWRHGCRVLNLSGGEPTLREDLEAVVQAASQRGFWTSMVTNGSGLTRARVAALAQVGLDSLLVSVDAADPATHDRRRGLPGSHGQALRCLRWIRDEFLFGHRRGGMMVVLLPENLTDIGRLVDLARGLGVGMAVQPYHAKKTATGDSMTALPYGALQALRAAARTRGFLLSSPSYVASLSDPERMAAGTCRAGRSYFSIDPAGRLHPCVDLPAVGHALAGDFSALDSAEARRCVQSCSGCWYSFRGETDLALTPAGYLEKLWLALTAHRCREACGHSPVREPEIEESRRLSPHTGELSCDEP